MLATDRPALAAPADINAPDDIDDLVGRYLALTSRAWLAAYIPERLLLAAAELAGRAG
ncbi:MAG: hypothetical protein L0332_34570 [Chloroflexi bacterium]|nr:hypothetical protein [Chloroflexota bacterium]